jgi:hypothetical protein
MPSRIVFSIEARNRSLAERLLERGAPNLKELARVLAFYLSDANVDTMAS